MIYRKDLIIRSRWFFDFEDEKRLKNKLLIYPLSMQESQDTKLILATSFTLGVARVTQYGLLLQISLKTVARDTIDVMHLYFSKNSFTFPVVS